MKKRAPLVTVDPRPLCDCWKPAASRDMLIADALLRFAEWCEQERGRA